MKCAARFIAVLVAVLVLSFNVWAKGASGGGGGGGCSSFSSGVRSYSPPSRPYSAPITKVAAVSTPSATGQTVRIVPVSRPATVVNKTVINKTVVNHNGPAGGGSYGGNDHFWSNWMMFSILSNNNRPQPQTIVVAGQPAMQTGAPLQAMPIQQQEPASNFWPWFWFLVILGCIGGGVWWIKKNADHSL